MNPCLMTGTDEVSCVLDLRSDAVTQPTDEMWDAMRAAKLGWSLAADDPSIDRLERAGVDIIGTEAALWVPTGTIGNLLAVLVHTIRGQQIIVDSLSHILWAEEQGFSFLAGVFPHVLPTTDGSLHPVAVEEAIVAQSFGHGPTTGLICLENTHNACGGTVLRPDQIGAIVEVGRRHNVPVHLDGARLINAAIASGLPMSAFCAGISSVTVNLNKGLSAPAGALLCGSREFIERCRPHLRRLGSATIHQAGILAAAGYVALLTMPPQIATDHAIASKLAGSFAYQFNDILEIKQPETNIILLRAKRSEVDAQLLKRELRTASVLVSTRDNAWLRLVTHRHITEGDIPRVIDAFRQALS